MPIYLQPEFFTPHQEQQHHRRHRSHIRQCHHQYSKTLISLLRHLENQAREHHVLLDGREIATSQVARTLALLELQMPVGFGVLHAMENLAYLQKTIKGEGN